MTLLFTELRIGGDREFFVLAISGRIVWDALGVEDLLDPDCRAPVRP